MQRTNHIELAKWLIILAWPLVVVGLLWAPSIQAESYLAPAASDNIGRAFTYQGYLENDGTTANGTYDFQFELYDAESDGNQIGSAVTQDDVTVTDGRFTVQLDFGNDAFDGNARWLSVGVRDGGSSDAYTTLNPRQALTPTPYGIYAAQATTALSTPWGGLTDVPADFADGVDNDAPSGAVMFFDLESCPTGWSEMTDAAGRAIVGITSAGTLKGTVGSPLANKENRSHDHTIAGSNVNTSSVAGHSHSASLTGTASSSGSHSHTWAELKKEGSDWVWRDGKGKKFIGWNNGVTNDGNNHYPLSRSGSNISTETYKTDDDGAHTHPVTVSGNTSNSSAHSHSLSIPTHTTNASYTADVMPYIQLLVCKKN